MSEWTDVCHIGDLQPDSGVCALIKGKQVAIFYMPKEQAVFAVDNYDPFGKANVLSRGMIGDIGGIPIVASPLYKQHFNLQTGVCLEDQGVKIGAYSIRIDNDRVSVRTEG